MSTRHTKNNYNIYILFKYQNRNLYFDKSWMYKVNVLDGFVQVSMYKNRHTCFLLNNWKYKICNIYKYRINTTTGAQQTNEM